MIGRNATRDARDDLCDRVVCGGPKKGEKTESWAGTVEKISCPFGHEIFFHQFHSKSEVHHDTLAGAMAKKWPIMDKWALGESTRVSWE